MAAYPGSKIAQENLEVFADMYQWLVSDVTSVVKEVLEASQSKPEKQVYLSLPRPGVSKNGKKCLLPKSQVILRNMEQHQSR